MQVRGVINLCEEYKGPLKKYKNIGIEELHLPTTDHFEPSVEDLIVSSLLPDFFLVHLIWWSSQLHYFRFCFYFKERDFVYS